jgi:hypothetical protein
MVGIDRGRRGVDCLAGIGRNTEAPHAEGIVGVALSQHIHAWGGHTTEP